MMGAVVRMYALEDSSCIRPSLYVGVIGWSFPIP